MLLAVDGYNAWLKPVYPNFQDFDYAALTMERASLVRHFGKLLLTADKGGLKRGGVVLIESHKHVEQGNKVEQDPMLGSSVLVEYTDYSVKEFESCLGYNEATGWIHRGISGTDADILAQLTKRNPQMLDQMLKTL